MSSECLQTLETNIINNVSSLKDEAINLKDTVIKRLPDEMEDFMTNANNWKTEWLLPNLLMMPLSNVVGGII